MTPLTTLRLARPFTLLAPAVGVIGGTFAASAAVHVPVSAATLTLAVLAALLATAASNAWNQVFDVEIDRVNKPTRPVPAGQATPAAAMRFGHACAFGALVAAAFVGLWFLACVAIGTLATWIYSAPPLRTKRLPVGALITIAVPRGALVPVAGWAVVEAPLRSDPWALGIVGGLYVLGAAVTKDFADVAGDRAHGCRTLPVLWGAERASRVVAPALVLPFLLYPLLGWLGWLSPAVASLAVLGGVLATGGALAAWLLLRDPSELARRGGNHPAWMIMYLLLLGAHIGHAIVYRIGS
ncbi:MAG: UbiA family prenyltransferase [Planctomycetota bacterium]|nr:UbiA family prenyltransferase [Planctomycetota bacterium]